jgi:glucose/arabinose dehydrogenase
VARIGLAFLLLLVVGCGTARELTVLLLARSARFLASPLLVSSPTPFHGLPEPFRFETPVVPFDYDPFALPSPTSAQPPPTPRPTPTPLPTATPFIPLQQLRKTPTPPTTVLNRGITLPPGFDIEVYVQGLSTVSYMAFGPGDVLFASLPGHGAVVAIESTDDPTRPGRMGVFAQGLSIPTGLAYYRGYLYVAEAHQVVRFPYVPGRLEAQADVEVVVPDLPVGPGFRTHAISFGPDGKLYVSVGASCNACREADYRRATIMRYDAEGRNEQIFAQGLRNVEGMCWYPKSGQLLVSNCSRRRMGDDLPPDTIEYVFGGANFGWPFCHAGDIPDPELGWPLACEGVPPPFQQLPAHTTPRGLCVYTGQQFPLEYYGDLFVALYGSWERSVPVGYKIVRLNVEDGKVVSQEDFASGWLVYGQPWGRPVDVTQAPDGSLLVSDDRAGAIYRIYYHGVR